MNKINLKYLRDLGKFNATRVYKNRYAKEDMPEFLEFFKKIGFIYDDGNCLRNPSTNQFVFKPTNNRRVDGVISIRSKDYVFEYINEQGELKKVSGNLSDIKFVDNGFFSSGALEVFYNIK